MKKRTFYLAIVMALSVVMSALAAPVDEAAARLAAMQVFNNPSGAPGFRSGLPSGNLLLLRAESSDVMAGQAAYFIYNTDNAFVVVAGDDRAGILARGGAPLDLNRIPCGLQWLLEMYKDEVDFLLAHPQLNITAPALGSGTSVAPLLTTQWGQGYPYNNDCPVYRGIACVTGCACTSLAQVINYWRYADITSPIDAYTTSSLGIYLEELPPADFDWDQMIENYYYMPFDDVQAGAVAKLMRYVGQAEQMDYTPDGSGASGSDVLRAALKFGYDEGVALLNKANFLADQWAGVLQAELQAGRPVVYIGHDKYSGGGHAFNVDGYDAENGLYHVNFGWDGDGDTYCALNDFSAYGYTFSNLQSMLIGIQPPDNVETAVTVAPSSLLFNSQPGNRVIKSFTVKGSALQGNLSLALDDPTGSYAINKTTLTAGEASDMATVQVTYNPAEVGVHNASVIISGGGIEPQTVSLSGFAVDVTPTIEVDPASLSFETTMGETVTSTFTVKGVNLTSGLTLALNGDSEDFAIDKSFVSVVAAAGIATVTVTYAPAEVGESDATVTVTGGGAEAKTVTLHGVANAPAAPAQPGFTLDCEQVDFGYGFNGYGENRKIMLTGEGLAGNLTLNLVGGDSIHFSVTPCTITPEMAAQGVEINVRFFPYNVGRLSTRLVISSPDVADKEVPLTGYGIKTGAYLYPSADSMSFETSVGRSVIKTVGVLKKNFEGWIAAPGANHAPGNMDPVLPVVITSVFCNIEGDEEGNFSIVSTNMTKNSAGCDSVIFTICYTPLEEGTHMANLVFSTMILNNRYPAYPVTIPITGVATGDSAAGDLNGDGQLTVSDVILLINDLISANRMMAANPVADMNGDGDVNITDVVNLIDAVMHAE